MNSFEQIALNRGRRDGLVDGLQVIPKDSPSGIFCNEAGNPLNIPYNESALAAYYRQGYFQGSYNKRYSFQQIPADPNATILY